MGEVIINDQIPILDFGNLVFMGQENEQEWRKMSRKVREACENHGGFLLSYDNISTKLREEMLNSMKSLFELPHETKAKFVSPTHYASYSCDPLRETLAIDDAHFVDDSRSFTNLMWPEGNPSFCDTLCTMSSKMQELYLMILKMIFKNFGTMKCHDQFVEDNRSLFRVMKYTPPCSDASVISLPAHTDMNTLTILCQDEVQGLQVMSKDGNWIQLMIPKGCFIVLIGDALKAWSNGRLHAMKHKVVMSGDKERYCCGLFTLPKDGALIEVPQELVDNDHPVLYKSFIFSDFFSHFVSNPKSDALELYAGV